MEKLRNIEKFVYLKLLKFMKCIQTLKSIFNVFRFLAYINYTEYGASSWERFFFYKKRQDKFIFTAAHTTQSELLQNQEKIIKTLTLCLI